MGRFAKKFVVMLLITLVAVGGQVRSANAIIMRADTAFSAYETYAQQPQFGSTGAIAFQTGSGVHYGSGVLIDPLHVLSASHLGYLFGDVSSFSFILGDNILTAPTHNVAVTEAHYYPGSFGRTDWGKFVDLAIFKLDTPIFDIAPAQLYVGDLSTNMAVSMGGYGRPGTNASGEMSYDGTKRIGTNTISGFGDDGSPDYFDYESYYAFTRFDFLSRATSLEAGNVRGDSGSPLRMADGSVAGIFSFFTGDAQPGNLLLSSSGFVDLTNPDINSWVRGNLTSVPEPGSMLLMGVASGLFGASRGFRRLRGSANIASNFFEETVRADESNRWRPRRQMV